MPDLSKLVFLRSLSASLSFVSDIRVVETKNGLSSRQWISRYCVDGIFDLGEDNGHWEAAQKDLHVDESDWTFGVRFFQAFTARELHYSVRTELDLDIILTKTFSWLDQRPSGDLDEALEFYREDLDIRFWVDAQRVRFLSTRLKELLTDYYIIASSVPLNEHSEFLVNPICSERAARSFSKILNTLYSTDANRQVFFYVRLGDLPMALASDDTQLKLIDWLSDKQLIPREYTTVEKCEVLIANDPVSASWLTRARQLLD